MTTVGTLVVQVIGDASRLQASLGAAEKTIERFGSRMFFLGSRMAAGVTLPIVGFMAAVNRAGSEFDSAMTESLAIMDNVSNEMRTKMESRALEIARTSKFTAKDIAKGYYDLASAGFSATESLESIGTVATFAQAGMMSMSTAGEHLAGSVNALGVGLTGAQDEAGAMARVADVLTAANNSALGTVQDFSEALSVRFAGAMRSTNMSLEDGVALLMAYAQNNIKGRAASQQAWMAVRDLQMATTRAGSAWKAYGISVFDAHGKMKPMPDILQQMEDRMKGMSDLQKTQMFKELRLPDRSRTALLQLLGKQDEIREFSEMLKNSTGAAATVAAKQAESMAVKWQMSLNRMTEAAIRLYNAFKPILSELFEMVGKAGDRLVVMAEKFNTLSDGQKKFAAGALAFLAAMGPGLAIFGSWTLALSGLGVAFNGIIKTATFVANLFPNIRAALAAQGVTATTAAKAWAVLSTEGVALFKSATALAGRLLTWVAIFDALRPGFMFLVEKSGILSKWWVILSKDVTTLVNGWRSAVDIVSTLADGLGILWKIVQFGWVQIAKLIMLIGSDMKEAFNTLLRVGNSVWSGLVSKAGEYGDAILDLLTGMGDLILKIPVLGDVLQGAFAFGKTLVSEFGDMVTFVFDGLLGKAKSFFDFMGEQTLFGSGMTQFLPKELTGFLDVWKKWEESAKKGGSYAEILARNRDILQKYAEDIGAVEKHASKGATSLQGLARAGAGVVPMFGQSSLSNLNRTGAIPGKGSFQAPMTAIDWGIWRAPDIKEIAEDEGSLFPDEKPEAAKARRLKTIFEDLMGSGKQTWQDTMEVFKLNEKAILANEGAMMRLKDAYLSVRDEIEPDPVFEKMFKTDIALQDMEKFAGKFTDFQRDFMEVQMGAMGQKEFFKKHEQEIERLIPLYHILSDEQKMMVNEYKRAETELDNFTRAVQRHIQSSNAFNELANASTDMNARMRDKEEELANFRLTAGDRVLRQLSKNYEQEKLAFFGAVAEKQRLLNRMEGDHLKMGEELFNKFVADGMAMLEHTKRLDLLRLASSMDVNPLIAQSFHKMTDEMLKDIIRTQSAVREEMQLWDQLSTTFGTWAGMFDEEGDGILAWLSTLAGAMSQATKAGADLANAIGAVMLSFDKGATSQQKVGAGIALFGAVMDGASAISRATSSSSRGRNIAGGAMTGAKIGANPALMALTMGNSVWIGAVVGGLVGAFRGRALRDAIRMTAKEFGVEVSDELAKAINKTAKEDFGGNKQLARMAHFTDILEEGGGLNPKNFDIFQDRLHDFFVFASNGMMEAGNALDLYSDHFGVFAEYINATGGNLANEFAGHLDTMNDMLQRGIIEQASVMKFFDKNIQHFIDNIEQSGHVAGRGWEHLLDLADQLETIPPKLLAYFRTVAEAGGGQWAAVIQGTTYKFEGLADKIKETQEEIDELNKKMAEGEVDDADTKALSEAQAKLNKLIAEQQHHAIGAREEMERLGFIVLSTFNAGMERGLGFGELMESIGPALDALVNGFKDLGIESDNAAIKHLIGFRNMYNANKQLFQGVDMLKEGMITLSKLGGLNAATFDAIGKQGVAMFRRVQGEVAAMGGTHEDALRPMAGWLAEMRHAAEEYGFTLDDATQEMIDQATELGILKPKAESATDIMQKGFADVTQAIVDMTDQLLIALGVVRDIGGAIGGIQPPNFQIPDRGADDPRFPGTDPGIRPGGDDGDSPGRMQSAATMQTNWSAGVDWTRSEPVTNYNTVNIETQTVDEHFVGTTLIPMLEQMGSRNTYKAQTRLQNATGVKR